jgi:L-rhamnose mutarotase
MKTWCLALDLHDDPALIEKYKWYHQTENIWPEVLESIRQPEILSERIYLAGNRLVMILETTDDFSFAVKSAADAANPKMQQWEQRMWEYQKALPHAKPGEKWILMEKIFEVRQP